MHPVSRVNYSSIGMLKAHSQAKDKMKDNDNRSLSDFQTLPSIGYVLLSANSKFLVIKNT